MNDKETDIAECNKILELFVGKDFIKKNYYPDLMDIEFELEDETDWCFDISWSWLLPVCKKFNDLRVNGTEIGKTNEWEQFNRDIWYSLNDYDIAKTYPKVVAAIKWANTQSSSI